MIEIEGWTEAEFFGWVGTQTARTDDVGDFSREWVASGRLSYLEFLEQPCIPGKDITGGFCEAVGEFNRLRKQPTILSARVPRHVPESRKIGLKMRAYIMERDHFTCRRCGAKSSDGVRLVVDHVVAVARGGSKDHFNLQTLCWDCNAGKSDREPHPHDLRPR